MQGIWGTGYLSTFMIRKPILTTMVCGYLFIKNNQNHDSTSQHVPLCHDVILVARLESR